MDRSITGKFSMLAILSLMGIMGDYDKNTFRQSDEQEKLDRAKKREVMEKIRTDAFIQAEEKRARKNEKRLKQFNKQRGV